VAQAAELERVAEHHAPGLGLEGVTLHRAPRTLGMGFP
jgi:hypothetical protein